MDVSSLITKAREAAKKRNFDYAIELYQNAIFMEPNHVEGRKELREVEIKRSQEKGGGRGAGAFLKGLAPMAKIKALGARKKWEEQARECEKYLRDHPRDPKVIYVLGVALVNMDSHPVAIQQFEDVLSIDPGHVDALSSLGLLFEEKDDYPKAISYFERVLKAKPHDQSAGKKIRDLAAKNTIQVGKMENTKDFRKQLMDETKAAKLESQAHLLRSEEEISEAIVLALAKANENPDKPEFIRKVGDLYRKKKDYVEAEKFYRQVLEKNPQDYFSKEAIDDMAIHRLEKAVGLARKDLTENKGKDQEQELRKVQLELVNFQIDAFGRRVKDHPTDTRLRFELGKYLYRGNHVNQAIAAFQKTVDDPKLRSDSHHYLGLCFRQKKTLDLAVKQFEQARAEHHVFNDKAKQITYDLAKTHLRMKNQAKAQDEFEKIFAVDINFRDVAQIMDELTQDQDGSS